MREKDNGPKYEEDSYAGCTANVVLITPEFIYCANSGDSRAIACVGGQPSELSRTTSPSTPSNSNASPRPAAASPKDASTVDSTSLGP